LRMRNLRRCLAMLLLVAMVGVPVAPARRGWAGPGRRTAGAVRTPVILLHGMRGSPSSTWGADDGGGTGLRAALVEEGYEEGKTLFAVDATDVWNADAPRVARLALLPAIDAALDASGSGLVDIVTHGSAALAARWYVEGDSYRGDVRNLVMIAPPNEGSFLANSLRLAGELERHVGADGARLAYLAERWKEEGPEAFADPFTYVGKRSLKAYGPMYDEYLLETRVLQDPLAAARPRPTFESWIAARHPDVYTGFICDTTPALLCADDPGRSGGERAWESDPFSVHPALGLSRGYYELVAIHVARQQRLLAPAGGARWWNPTADLPELVGGWKDFLSRWAARALLCLWGDAVGAVRARGLSVGVAALAGRLGIDPLGEGVTRLVTRAARYRVGRTAGRAAYDTLTANAALDEWNSRAAGGRVGERSWNGSPYPRPRYAVIAGRVLNPWPVFDVPVGANDLAVEVESAFLEQSDDDVFELYSSATSTNHFSLPRCPDVVHRVVELLSDPYEVVARDRIGGEGWSSSEQAQAWLWRPSYIEYRPGEAGAPRDLEIEVRASGVPAPLALGSWAYVEVGDGRMERIEPVEAGGALRLAVGGTDGWRRILVGVRLQGTRVRCLPFLDRPRQACSIALVDARATDATVGDGSEGAPSGGGSHGLPEDEIPGEGGEGSTPAGSGGTAGSGAEGDGGAPEDGPGDAGGDADGESQEPAVERSWEDAREDPLILVQLRTKKTTLKKEKREAHARWRWTWGDGTSGVDDDPAHERATSSHVYSEPGRYEVVARSETEDGKALREMRWEVVVPPPAPGREPTPVTRSFTAETATPPDVSVDIEGPREWVAGRPAEFRVRARVTAPPYAERQTVRIDPGRRFRVQWKRPGTYRVEVAVTVRTYYRFPEGGLVTWNTYLFGKDVTVLATSVSD